MEFDKGKIREFDGYISDTKITKHNHRISESRSDVEEEFWSALNYYSEIESVGKKLIKSFGTKRKDIIDSVFLDFQAYSRQAKSFYEIAKKTSNRSSSLLYYYCFLNLFKAGIVLRESNVVGKSLFHGLKYNVTNNRVFEKETVIVTHKNNDVFHMFYRLYFGNDLKKNNFGISKLFGYCTDISLQFDKCGYGDRKIIPVFYSMLSKESEKKSWPILGIPSINLVKQYPGTMKTFIDNFEEIEIHKSKTKDIFGINAGLSIQHTFFQSKITFDWIQGIGLPIFECVDMVKNSFKNTYQTNHFNNNSNFLITLPYSIKNQTPLNEMTSIYIIMFYLSSLVRYKPEYLEKLLSDKSSWMIDSFIKCCPPTFLRNVISWIINEDNIVYRT